MLLPDMSRGGLTRPVCHPPRDAACRSCANTCAVNLPRLQAFELCESLNAVGAVLDLHMLLENRKTSPDSKMAVLEALGDISKAAGMWYIRVWPLVGPRLTSHGKENQGERCWLENWAALFFCWWLFGWLIDWLVGWLIE